MDFFSLKHVNFNRSIVVFSRLAIVYYEINFLFVFIILTYVIYIQSVDHAAV